MARVKICGITNLRDALKAHELGADFLGFVFFEQSQRRIEPEHARVIIEDLPQGLVKVGLFFNQDLEYVRSVGKLCRIDILQLHGDEDPKYTKELAKDFKIIKSFKVKDESSLNKVNIYERVDYYLFDTYVEGAAGGTGESFDWNVLKGKNFNKPVFLAGGLTSKNVQLAVETVNPFCVDVATGVEKSPGIKDYKLLKEFIDNAKKK